MDYVGKCIGGFLNEIFGKALELFGVQLIAVYLVIAIAIYFLPLAAGSQWRNP